MERKKSISDQRWDRWQELLGKHFGIGDPLSPADEQAALRQFFNRISPAQFEKMFDTSEKREEFLDRVDQGETVEDLVSEQIRKTREFAKIMNAVSHATQVVLLHSGDSDDEPWEFSEE